MRIGIFTGDLPNDLGAVDAVVAAARQAADDGFATYWLSQIFGVDALTALAVIGREVPGIELGTAVVPTYPRHPMVLAGQALTTQSASGGRLVLGVGLSHQVVIESMFGYSFAKPVRHMKEYLSILQPLLRGEAVSFSGESVSCNGQVSVAGASACPVLIAALGPQMLQLAGAMTDGTITWMTGPATIRDLTAPAVAAAAERAGRPAPRVAVGLPVCVTDDPAAARERAAGMFQIYGQLPSYRAMLDREGATGPADVAIVGDEAAVRAGLEQVAEAGATDFVAAEFGATDDEKARTRAVLRAFASA